uniref:Uncharacterized protein n=1 Tax=Chenopodium quinoa TaxID=63459 RepID=A0A803M2R7_CHEQI
MKRSFIFFIRRFLHNVIDVNRISEYEWCSYTIKSLIVWVLCCKKGVTRFFCGPLPFLWVCYFDRLQKMTLEQRRDFTLIKVWTIDLIKDRIDLELRLDFGLGTLLDRVQPPIVVDISIPQHLLGMNQELVVVPDQPKIRQQQEEEQLDESNVNEQCGQDQAHHQRKTREHQKPQGEQQQKEHQNGGEYQKHEKKVPSNVQPLQYLENR